MPFATLAKPTLFARLAEGHAARITVVTPNRRLAQELVLEFDAFQIKGGLSVWEAADILPFGVFAERLYEDALYSELVADLPLLLTPAQEQHLWEEILGKTGLLAIPQAAAQCREAWRLKHAWRIGAGAGNEDAQAFAAWAREYEKRTQGDVDAARLPDLVSKILVRKPQLLVAYAFDVVPPQVQDFFESCAKQGIAVETCGPEKRASRSQRTSFQSGREELEAAAQWARARLEAGAKHIGVVVPGLEKRRREVVRVFSRVMHPAFNLPGNERKAPPFNVSLGAPLADYPLVRTGLLLLQLSAGEIPFADASRLIRSAFIGGADAEIAKRALLDADLRRRAPARLTLGKLVGLVAGCPALRSRLEALFSVPKIESAPPHDWGRHFSALLEAAGFPGERSLDSDEFQTRAKFNESLAEFARLERIAGNLSFEKCLSILRGICRETLFQPETPDAPIQVLGVLESAGLEFDCLWVSGLTDEAWPLHAKPNPFIPPALQRKAGIPEASPEATLARAKRITEGWLGAAGEVVVSHAVREEDRELIGSPLISFIPVHSETQSVPAYPRTRDLIFAARRTEPVADGKAPALATKTPKGGTRILSDQAACPFRAFARHRLAAEPLEEPVEGLDARARGLLLHTLMKELWTELKGSAGLQADCAPAIEKAAAAAVAEAKLEEPFASLERKRLAKLAREWLEVERERDPFEVVHLERKMFLGVAGLQLNGRIDRMDRLEAGGHALIDYKSGKPTPNEWLGERPDDPQMPLYALNAKEDIAAVAFAKLKTGEMRYMGFSDRKGLIPEVKPAKDWNALLADWRKELDALGAGFAAGDARVDPKKLLQTCRYCDLQPLCRVYERVNALGDAEEEGDV